MDGILVIDKPGGMTSRDVVNRVQRWFPRRTRVGHAGTLDPLATGVLVVCIGAATRLAEYVQAMPKTYASRFRLGATSTTDDADGAITPKPDAIPPTRDAVAAALAGFVGSIEQVPPAFSALKVDGRRAHELARKGEDVPLAARVVRVDAVRLIDYCWPFVDVEIDCGKGTYIRSIARDLGTGLGCGGLVETLRRTRIGPFRAEDALPLDADRSMVSSWLRPASEAVSQLPRVILAPRDASRFAAGQVVGSSESCWPTATEIRVEDEGGKFLGVGIVLDRTRLKPHRVIVTGTAAGHHGATSV
jgi:tRNA pseudouridine55 synthase